MDPLDDNLEKLAIGMTGAEEIFPRDKKNARFTTLNQSSIRKNSSHNWTA
jgi:hypothetical protein